MQRAGRSHWTGRDRHQGQEAAKGRSPQCPGQTAQRRPGLLASPGTGMPRASAWLSQPFVHLSCLSEITHTHMHTHTQGIVLSALCRRLWSLHTEGGNFPDHSLNPRPVPHELAGWSHLSRARGCTPYRLGRWAGAGTLVKFICLSALWTWGSDCSC